MQGYVLPCAICFNPGKAFDEDELQSKVTNIKPNREECKAAAIVGQQKLEKKENC